MAGKVPWRVHSWGQLRQSTRRPGAPWKPRRLFEPTSPVPPSTLALVYAAWRSNVGPVVDRAGALATARMALHALKYNVLGSSSNQRPWRWAAIKKAESLAKRERRPILVHPNGVQEWASFGVFDTRLGHTIGFANPPASGV